MANDLRALPLVVTVMSLLSMRRLFQTAPLPSNVKLSMPEAGGSSQVAVAGEVDGVALDRLIRTRAEEDAAVLGAGVGARHVDGVVDEVGAGVAGDVRFGRIEDGRVEVRDLQRGDVPDLVCAETVEIERAFALYGGIVARTIDAAVGEADDA